MESARLKPQYFTRDRVLSFPTVLTFLLSSVQGAVQSELDQFFANLRNRADSVRWVSAQAFFKARYKISALVFGDVNQKLMALVEEYLPVPRWPADRGERWRGGPSDDDERRGSFDRHGRGVWPVLAGN